MLQLQNDYFSFVNDKNLDNTMEIRLVPIKMTEMLKKWAGQHAQELSLLNIKIGAAVEHCSVSLGGDSSAPCIAHRIDF